MFNSSSSSLSTARYHTKAAAARPISPCGGDLSGRFNTSVGVGSDRYKLFGAGLSEKIPEIPTNVSMAP